MYKVYNNFMLVNIGEKKYVSMFVNMPVNMSWFIGMPRKHLHGS